MPPESTLKLILAGLILADWKQELARHRVAYFEDLYLDWQNQVQEEDQREAFQALLQYNQSGYDRELVYIRDGITTCPAGPGIVGLGPRETPDMTPVDWSKLPEEFQPLAPEKSAMERIEGDWAKKPRKPRSDKGRPRERLHQAGWWHRQNPGPEMPFLEISRRRRKVRSDKGKRHRGWHQPQPQQFLVDTEQITSQYPAIIAP